MTLVSAIVVSGHHRVTSVLTVSIQIKIGVLVLLFLILQLLALVKDSGRSLAGLDRSFCLALVHDQLHSIRSVSIEIPSRVDAC